MMVVEKKSKKPTPFSIRLRGGSWEYFQFACVGDQRHWTWAEAQNYTNESQVFLDLSSLSYTHPTSVQKKTASSQSKPAASSVPSVQSAKKRAGLKSKTKGRKEGEHVLGGADYVTLLSGGRRKAADEAAKLPPPE